jgi:hypothetical protein
LRILADSPRVFRRLESAVSRVATTGCVLLLLLGGCPDQAPDAGGKTLADPDRLTGDDTPKKTLDFSPANHLPSEVIATVDGRPITYEQIHKPMTEAYGLQFLAHLVRIEICKAHAEREGVSITPADVVAERNRAMEQLFINLQHWDQFPGKTDEEKKAARKAEMERLLPQFLQNQRISEQEFDLAMVANAYCWKIAEKQVRPKITDAALQDVFRIKYGEKVRIRHIQVANRNRALAAKGRIDRGEPFEAVAKDVSLDLKTKDKGGEIRPFSRAEPGWPESIKEAAFSLPPGEVSDVLDAGDTWHIIKVDERIPPSNAVKFEDHKDVLADELFNVMMNFGVKRLRELFEAEATAKLKINDPGLRKQYVARAEKAAGVNAANDPALKNRMVNDARNPVTRPTTRPDGHGEVARPPATRPGAN